MIRSFVPRILALVAALHILGPAHARAQGMPMPGQGYGGPAPTAPYLSGDGSFGLRVPMSWAIKEQRQEPGRVLLRSTMAADAFVEVRRFQVTPGARPKQLVLRALESRLSKLPHFASLMRRDLAVAGLPAASVMGTYWYQGNAQFPRAVEELFVVTGNEGYMFHFECFEPMAQALAPDVNSIYLSFAPHPPALAPAPMPNQSDDASPWDSIPF